MKKTMLIVICFILIISLLGGCVQKKKSDEPAQGSKNGETEKPGGDKTTEPEVKERPILKITAIGPADSRGDFWEKESTVQLLKDKFGIEFDTQWLGDKYSDQFLTIFAAGAEPEFAFAHGSDGDTLRLGMEGKLYSVNDYIDKVPNYRALFSDEDWGATIMGWAEGHNKLYAFLSKRFNRISTTTFLYRQDVLDKYGLEIPETVEDLLEVLRTLKQETGVTPMVYDGGGDIYRNIAERLLAPEYRTRRNFHFDPDMNQTVYGPATDKYRDMLRTARLMIDESLLFTYEKDQQEEARKLIETGQVYVSYGDASSVAHLELRMQDSDPGAKWVWAKRPVVVKGEPSLIDIDHPYNAGPCITKKASEEKLERLLEFIDWMCTDEGLIWQNYGIEGESFEYVDGKIKWMDHIEHVNNPDGVEPYTKYALNHSPGFVLHHVPYDWTVYPATADQLYIEMAEDIGHFQQRVYWSFDNEADEIKYHQDTDVFDDIRKAYTVPYLKGELDDSSWDEFVSNLKRANYVETRELVQIVHDRSITLMNEVVAQEKAK